MPGRATFRQVRPCRVLSWYESRLRVAAPTVEQIDLGVAWSLEQNRQGRGVYVHCAHGHGRSNVALCAVLMSVGAANSIQEVLSPTLDRAYAQRWQPLQALAASRHIIRSIPFGTGQ